MIISDPVVEDLLKKFGNARNPLSQDEIASLIQPLNQFQRVLLFCKTKKSESGYVLESKELEEERKLYEKTIDLFSGNLTSPDYLLQRFDQLLQLIEAGLYEEILDLEDFRAILRHLYVKMEDFQKYVLRINRFLLRYLNNRTVDGQTGISNLTSLLRYLGVPAAAPEVLEEDMKGTFPNDSSTIDRLVELPVSSAQRHPDHIKDLVTFFNFENDLPLLLQWLDHESLSILEKATSDLILQGWEPEEPFTMEKLVDSLRAVLPTEIPIAFETIIKPFTRFLSPRTLRTGDIGSNVPPEILQSYVEKLAFPVSRQTSEKTRIIFLGGSHIGTMAILISTGISNILIDFGMSVANYGVPAWHPILNHLDAIFITHAHLDHSGAVPFLFGLGYRHRVFGSALTKALTEILLLDSQRMMQNNINSQVRLMDPRFRHLSQSKWIHRYLDSYVPVRSNVTYQITPDIAVTPIPSYHIQGAMGFFVETGHRTIYYTGDMNLEPSVLFKERSPKLPTNADLTILDATYFGQKEFNISQRDSVLIKTVKEGKRVIIPAFSVGRAQEVMITLDQAGLTKERKVTMLGLATKASRLTGLKSKGFFDNSLTTPFEDEIIITGGGMLSGGIARELVEQTKDDPDTSILLCGYLAKNTLGYRLLHGMEPRYKQKVAYARFSGHSSSDRLKSYINSISGTKALVHVGELSKDPFASNRARQNILSAHPECYIPTTGSVLEL
ncbi:MAG: MBL fold metallo-hydrolase [Candidatus Heimdallarchaeota archaeon]